MSRLSPYSYNYPQKARSTVLPSSLSNPIKSIIWSSFDYTSGPVLNLSLEYTFENNGCDQSSHESTASSSPPYDDMSMQGQFEEIDDIFDSQLISADTSALSHVDTGDTCFSILTDTENLLSDSILRKEMEESGIDSGVATNLSVHSELSQALSNSGHNFPEELTPSFSEMQAELSKVCDDYDTESSRMLSPLRATSATSSKSNSSNPMNIDSQNELFSSMSGDIGVPQMTDEEYVTKHALAEQITGNFLPCDPIVHKLTVIPARRLAFGSHIFWLNPGSQDLLMTAFSILLSDSDEDWYTEYRDLFDSFMEDLISLFKAKYESGESILSLTSFVDDEFKKLITLIGNLKVLTFGSREFRSEDNLLLSPLPKEYSTFLYRAISGVIMSKGHTYIYGGADYGEIRRLLLTLSLFLDEQTRRLCTNPYATHINPYLCLQVVNEKEGHEMKRVISKCRWPACVVDVKRKKVYFTGLYWDHQKRRRNVDLNENLHHKTDVRWLTINSIPSQYSSLLSSISRYPAAINDVLSHFHLLMKNEARTFVELVKSYSEPSKNSKDNPYSSKFKLSEINNLLRVTTFEGLAIVLANAESLLPSISDFISENAQLN